MRTRFHQTGTPFLALLATAALCLPSPAAGQNQRSPAGALQEAQVTRADSAAVLLFAAREFQAQGQWEIAVALFQMAAERFGNTPAGLEARAALESPSEEGGSRASRVELQVWSTLYGAWLGVAIPAAFGADGPEAYGAGLLLGAPGGFFGGRALGKSRPLSMGQVRAITFGSLWGTWQGFGWAEVADWGEEEVCDYDVCDVGSRDGETVMKSLLLGGLAGVGAGLILSRNPIPSGVATSANFGAFWGTWFGVAGGILGDLEGDGLMAATLLAGDAGLLAGAGLASKWNMSRNRARLISIAGVLGGLAGAGLDLLVQPNDEKVAIAIPLVGSVTGLLLGSHYTSDENRGSAGSNGATILEEASPTSFQDPSLLSMRDGRIQAGIPAPFLTLLPMERGGRTMWRPGLGVTLFSARF